MEKKGVIDEFMLNLIPKPTGLCQEHPDTFRLPKQICISWNGFEQWCIAAFQMRTGLTVSTGAPWLILEKDDSFAAEAYELDVSAQEIRIRAACEKGIIWALTTVVCLLENGKIPCITISDTPRYAHRGLSLDCVRHFFDASEVKKVIEELSLGKMNVLHWHLTDDQGWRIESKKFPKLHETSSEYFTQDEIREVVEFARIRGVEIIPEIDLPGHTSALLAAYPQYSCSEKLVSLARCGGIYPIVLCPGKEEVFAFLQELLDEILPLFPAERFHIGGDETPKTEWEKCPHCAARMQQEGLDGYAQLQGYFTARIAGYLKQKGKTPICWNETLRSVNAPKDIQIQYWTLQHRDSMEAFVKNGGTWIYSDMFELYLDYPYSMTSMKKLYETNAHFGKASFARNSGLLGMEAAVWCEHIAQPQRLENLLFPRIYALAEICWSGAGNYRDFCSRLEKETAKPCHNRISYTDRSWWEPKGRARRKEAIEYFTAINSGMDKETRSQTVKSAAPTKEFAQSFMNQFFKPLDIPALLIAMMKHS